MVDKLVKSVDDKMLGWIENILDTRIKGIQDYNGVQNKIKFRKDQFSCSVVSDSLRPHEPQHTRPSCPSPTPGVYPNSCPLSQ